MMGFMISCWENALFNRPIEGTYDSLEEVKSFVRKELDRRHYQNTGIWEISTPDAIFMGIWPKNCEKLQFPRFQIEKRHDL
jgi:hypothetical protein